MRVKEYAKKKEQEEILGFEHKEAQNELASYGDGKFLDVIIEEDVERGSQQLR